MSSKDTDLVLVRPPHTSYPTTVKQAHEIALAADPVIGPHYFLNNFFHIQHPTKGRMLYHPYGYQKDLIDTYHNYRFSINLLSRQLGKCLKGESNWINIRNKYTRKEYDLPIRVFYEWNKAKEDDMPLPDISKYEKLTHRICNYCSPYYDSKSILRISVS